MVANGDLRLPVNQARWAPQKEMEGLLAKAVAEAGYELIRAHPYKEDAKHGFIQSQKEGMRVFAGIDPDAKLIVAESLWQYSHHLLPGINPNPWATGTSISDWFYDRNWTKCDGGMYRKADWVICTLVDIVSKNGNLRLNVVQRPDGPLNWTRDENGLTVQLPEKKPGEYAFAFKITGLTP